MKLSKTAWWMVGGATLAGISVGGYLLLSKKEDNKTVASANASNIPTIGSGIEIGPTTTTKITPNWNQPFHQRYNKDVQNWIAPKRLKLLDTVSANNYAKTLKEAKGFFNDNEEAVEEIFKKRLEDKSQVSSLSTAFYKLYQKDLWQHLNSFLSQSEMHQYVTLSVKKLPNYQTL